ncbi:MAG: hypothetical protein JWO04_2691 [Gammaproteobacteria bacterium]|nr:hypothetical protein [Gammaproteobacteria bacterium]
MAVQQIDAIEQRAIRIHGAEVPNESRICISIGNAWFYRHYLDEKTAAGARSRAKPAEYTEDYGR